MLARGVLQCTYSRDLPATFPGDIGRICGCHSFAGALRGTRHARHSGAEYLSNVFSYSKAFKFGKNARYWNRDRD